ncbi:MAG: STAS domain-containing protein [bacterium]
MMLHAIVNDYEDVRVVTLLTGVIKFSNYEEVFNKVKSFIGDDAHNIVLDMEKVEFMDSLSLGMLVPLLLYTRRLGGNLKIANPNEKIRKLFGILQLDKIVDVFGSVDEAVKNF